MNIFPHLFVVKFGLFVLKRQKINEKEAEDEPFKTLLNTVLRLLLSTLNFYLRQRSKLGRFTK